MKTKFLFFVMLACNLTFGQFNFSRLGVSSPIPTISSGFTAPPSTEIFRFQPGVVTQQDDALNQNFGFTNSRWFAMGRVPAGTQTFYGLRFQLPGRGLVMGYSDLIANNPVIQWIGSGLNRGNLEFRSALAFGAPGVPATDLLVATMTNDGRTVFGNINTIPISAGPAAKVSVVAGDNTTNTTSTALSLFSIGSQSSTGLIANASNGAQSNIAVKGVVNGTGAFEAAIYGESEASNSVNLWAGYFDGFVYGTNFIKPSDAKLKENVKSEIDALEKLAKLKPVTYEYKKISQLNLPNGTQHGFLAQELATIFPEFTKDVSKPIFDKDNKQISTFDYKSVDYLGLISVLTAGINDLNQKVILLEKKLENNNIDLFKKRLNDTINTDGAFMEQNIPNPFDNQTTIRYQLPDNTNNAEIIVFDLNGKMIKSYPINKNQSELTIKSAEIGKGIFIYSLVSNGQEIITKKMLVK